MLRVLDTATHEVIVFSKSVVFVNDIFDGRHSVSIQYGYAGASDTAGYRSRGDDEISTCKCVLVSAFGHIAHAVLAFDILCGVFLAENEHTSVLACDADASLGSGRAGESLGASCHSIAEFVDSGDFGSLEAVDGTFLTHTYLGAALIRRTGEI